MAFQSSLPAGPPQPLTTQPPRRPRHAWRWLGCLGLLTLAGLAACGDDSPARPAGPDVVADLVLVGGRVVTMAPGSGTAEAVAVADGRVVLAGSDRQVLELEGPETRRIELDGRTVLPGVVDAHTHMFNDAWRLDLDLAGAQEVLLRNGITTVGNAFVTPEFLEEMRTFEESGALVVRTSLYLIYTDNCGGPRGDWWRGHPPTREFGERLRIGGIKLFMDGGTCGRPAVRQEFLPGSGFGDLFLTADDVEQAVAAAEETGHQVVIHAMGDAAVEAAQDGIEAGLGGRPNTLRHRIDHNVLVPPDLLARYREIGIQPVLFGPYIPFREMMNEEGCGFRARNELWESSVSNTRRVLDELPELQPAWHGDDPWVGPVSPFRELYLMTTRIRRWEGYDDVCPPENWQLATAVTAADGLEMMTTSSARALFRETEVGSLEPGKLADLVVLPRDPLAMVPEELWELEVSMTMVGGAVEFCREGEEALCGSG